MDKKRFEHIDFLRAVAIVGVIVTHTLSYNSGDLATNFVWNYLHFVVVAFVFCAGYVWMQQYRKFISGHRNVFAWYKKRLVRLVVPYYWYLLAHYSLWFLFPTIISGQQLQKSLPFIFKSIFFIGGVDANWLPLLFIQLTLLFPLMLIIMKNQLWKRIYLSAAIVTTVFLTFRQFPHSLYRHIMWIPWSLILFISLLVFRSEQLDNNDTKRITRYVSISLVSLLIYTLLFAIGRPPNGSLRLIDHKYPPDFFYLSYATMMTFIVVSAYQLPLFQTDTVKTIYRYISKNSYQLFFIHYIVLDAVVTLSGKNTSLAMAMAESLIVLLISLLICRVLGYVIPKLGFKNKTI